MKSFLKLVGAFTTALVVAFGVFMGVAVVWAAWSEPAQPAPNGNVALPVNESASAQYKSGALGVGGFFTAYSSADVYGALSVLHSGYGNQFVKATPPAGKNVASLQSCSCDTSPTTQTCGGTFTATGADGANLECKDQYQYSSSSGQSCRPWMTVDDCDAFQRDITRNETGYIYYSRQLVGGDALVEGGVTLGTDRRTEWPLARTRVIGMGYNTPYKCPSGYIPTGCVGSGEKSCYPSFSNGIPTGEFTCVWDGDKGSNCYLFCALK